MQGTSSAGGKCLVQVKQGDGTGTAKVNRDELPNGNCLCIVTTGSRGMLDDIVTNLQRDRECVGAPASPAQTSGTSGAGSTGGAGGGGGGVLGGVVGAAAVGGLAVGLGGKSPG